MLLEERAGQATTEAEAIRFARELYGLEAAAKTLPGEYDDNFHLTTIESAPAATSVAPETAALRPGGAAFVLKVMHPARERELIDLQCRALQHLAQRAPQLGLPRVCPLGSGAAFASVQGSDGLERLAWLLTYVPGTVAAGPAPHSPQLLVHA